MRNLYLSWLSFAVCTSVVGADELSPGTGNPFLKAIYKPTVVAVQPDDAARDMCVTADGEIRHYGFMDVGGEKVRVYISSKDGINWSRHIAHPKDVGAMVKSPWSGTWIYFNHQSQLVRSKKGPGDTEAEVLDLGYKKLELRQLIAMKTRRRWIAVFSDVSCKNGECYHTKVAYSDDDGKTWHINQVEPIENTPRIFPGGQRRHWFNNGCEPTVVELKDGTLRLGLRSSGPHHAFCISKDGGKTWSKAEPDTAFWATNTMPLFFRLSDGRLLFFWNNTAILPTMPISAHPEVAKKSTITKGIWEAVFTNRDALHAAISDDDGKTWKGFREIALNDIRNRCDFRTCGIDNAARNDKSVHQSQAIELAEGKVLLAFGQNKSARRMIVFDPDWLLEKGRVENFDKGLDAISHHLYVKSYAGSWGKNGHCSWNRIPGAVLSRDPDHSLEKTVVREALQICRIADPRLFDDRQGATWNFPAAAAGSVELECRIEGAGFRLSLLDHWINPCDSFNAERAPFSQAISSDLLPKGRWAKLAVVWDIQKQDAELFIDGKSIARTKLKDCPRFGLSYLHLQSLAETHDPDGSYFRSFRQRSR